MSKRNIAYIKPQEPSFLRKIKEQVGYKEGPTVDTKREESGPVDDSNISDTEEEQPTVVVLNPGDLTAEEAAKIQDEQEKEKTEAPADLNLPIVFKPPSKSACPDKVSENKGKRSSSEDTKKSKKIKSNKPLLSFDEEENDD